MQQHRSTGQERAWKDELNCFSFSFRVATDALALDTTSPAS